MAWGALPTTDIVKTNSDIFVVTPYLDSTLMGIVEMKKIKRNMRIPTTLDAIKAMKRGSREAEMDLLGPGFHSHNKIHKSDKVYTRKKKHKGEW